MEKEATEGQETETMETKDVTIDPKATADRLGIPQDFVEKALETDGRFEKVEKKDEKTDEKGESDEKIDESTKKDDETGKETSKDDKKEETRAATDEEFADDVIPGVKGADFKKIPKAAQEALAEFYVKTKEIETQHTQNTSKIERLMNDPVIAERARMLDDGRQQFDVRKITTEEKKTMVGQIQQKYGLTEEEASGIINDLSDGIDAAAAEAGEDYAKNAILQKDKQVKGENLIKKGQELILSMSQFNKKLALKETDMNKFFTKDGLNKNHPEIKAFEEGAYKILQLCMKLGMNYGDVVEKYGAKKLYALAAAEYDWPIALNTGDRDKKMIADATREKMMPFMRKTGSAGLSPEGKGGDGKQAIDTDETHTVDGYDVVRLYADSDYYRQSLEAKPMDEAHKEKIDRLVAMGKKYSQKSKTR